MPGWVEDDVEQMENRVLQTQASNDDKKLMERLGEHYEPLTVMDDVLARLHRDKELAALLVPKLKQGCEQWLAAQKASNEEEAALDAQAPKQSSAEEDR